jgi:hypothetical protein
VRGGEDIGLSGQKQRQGVMKYPLPVFPLHASSMQSMVTTPIIRQATPNWLRMMKSWPFLSNGFWPKALHHRQGPRHAVRTDHP